MNEKTHIESANPLEELVSDMLTLGSLWQPGALSINANFTPGHPKVLFVGGENCSGKSYFVENLRVWAKHYVVKGTSISVSIRERTGAGTSDMSGMRRTMMFGDESEQSTGATSVQVLGTAFTTLEGRANEGYRALLVLDEPEIGLSEGYTRALGDWLGQQLANISEKSIGVVIVSHSRALAQAVAAKIGTPAFVHMGRPVGFNDWVANPEYRTVEELLALKERGHTVRKEIWALEDSLTKNK